MFFAEVGHRIMERIPDGGKSFPSVRFTVFSGRVILKARIPGYIPKYEKISYLCTPEMSGKDIPGLPGNAGRPEKCEWKGKWLIINHIIQYNGFTMWDRRVTECREIYVI